MTYARLNIRQIIMIEVYIIIYRNDINIQTCLMAQCITSQNYKPMGTNDGFGTYTDR